MRHSTEDVIKSQLRYRSPYTAFYAARNFVVDQLKDNTMQPTELLSLGIEDEEGRLTDASSITRDFPASTIAKEETYRALIPRR